MANKVRELVRREEQEGKCTAPLAPVVVRGDENPEVVEEGIGGVGGLEAHAVVEEDEDAEDGKEVVRHKGLGALAEAAEEDGEEKMSSGLRAGLVRGSDLKEEAAQVRAKRRAAVDEAPDEETGKGAETVYRNKEGKRITREEWAEQTQKKKPKRASDYPEQELEWGGGLKQQQSKEAEREELARVAQQPFARYQPDEKYMQELKEKSDWNDPMRNYQAEEDLRKEQKAAAKKPKCPHPPWPNRFDIGPGYRWDGKVRGNNYERKWMETKNERERKKAEAYMYDMEEQ